MKVPGWTLWAAGVSVAASTAVVATVVVEQTGHLRGLLVVLAALLVGAAWSLHGWLRVRFLGDHALYLTLAMLALLSHEILPRLRLLRGPASASFSDHALALLVQGLIELPLALVALLFFTRSVMSLSGRELPRGFRLLVISCGSALMATAVVLLQLSIWKGLALFGLFRLVALWTAALTSCTLPLFMALGLVSAQDRTRARSTLRFASAQCLAGIAILSLLAFSTPEASTLLVTPAVLFLPLLALVAAARSLAASRQSLAQAESTALAGFFEQHRITRREQEVIRLVAQGKRNNEIEEQLCISVKTVKRHLSNIFSKLGVTNRVQLATMYLEAARGEGQAERDQD